MAGIPLNTFRTVRKVVPLQSLLMSQPPPPFNSTNGYFLYQAPQGVTSIVIMSQVSNIDNLNASPANIHDVTMWHYQSKSGSFTHLIQNFAIPPQDAASLISGKLVLETGDQLYVSSTTTDQYLQLIASIIETANQ